MITLARTLLLQQKGGAKTIIVDSMTMTTIARQHWIHRHQRQPWKTCALATAAMLPSFAIWAPTISSSPSRRSMATTTTTMTVTTTANLQKQQQQQRRSMSSTSTTDSSTQHIHNEHGWQVIIGLEIHAQVIAASKLFSAASTGNLAAAPNSETAFVDAAFPGTLPVLNRAIVHQALRAALALHCDIPSTRPTRFVRKHYFYCDMPQGYQITQTDAPIATNGQIVLSPSEDCRVVRIAQIQMEQDSGKAIHGQDRSYIDLNRAGMPLLEIVSRPDMRSAQEAAAFIRKLQTLLRYTGVSNALMEEGSMRCDVNVSISNEGIAVRGERVEIKNLNSVKSVVRAIDYEVRRQIHSYESGGQVDRETRAYDNASDSTVKLRSKEDLLDYRFYPDPDLPPLHIVEDDIASARASLPELPDDVVARWNTRYGLMRETTELIVAHDPSAAVPYIDTLITCESSMDVSWDDDQQLDHAASSLDRLPQRDPNRCLNWILSDVLGRLPNAKPVITATGQHYEDATVLLTTCTLGPRRLSAVVDAVEAGYISGRVGKLVLDAIMLEQDPRSVRKIVEMNGWAQVSDEAILRPLCESLLERYPDEVQKFVQTRRARILGFFMKHALEETDRKANPKVLSSILHSVLNTRVSDHMANTESSGNVSGPSDTGLSRKERRRREHAANMARRHERNRERFALKNDVKSDDGDTGRV